MCQFKKNYNKNLGVITDNCMLDSYFRNISKVSDFCRMYPRSVKCLLTVILSGCVNDS